MSRPTREDDFVLRSRAPIVDLDVTSRAVDTPTPPEYTLDQWIESLHEDHNRLVWVTKAELRQAVALWPVAALATPDPSIPERPDHGAFRRELDRTEAVRGALHPVVCESDHDHATAPEHWRCVIAADTAIEAFPDPDAERLARAICGSRMPFVEEEDDLYVDDRCRAWASAAAAEYSRLGSSPDLTGPAREADPK